MAYFVDEEREEAPSTGAPASSAVGAGGGGAAGAAVPGGMDAQAGKPSRFVSFDRYFNSNAATAKEFAGKVAQGVEDKAWGAQGALDTATRNFRQRVDEAANVEPEIQAGERDTFTATPAVYQGPKSFMDGEDVSSVQRQLTDANSALQQTRDAYGLQALIQTGQNTNAGYTDAMGRFDANLIGRAGSERFAGLWEKFSGLKDGLEKAATEGNEYVRQGQERLSATNKAAEERARVMSEEAAAERKRREAEWAAEWARNNPNIERRRRPDGGYYLAN